MGVWQLKSEVGFGEESGVETGAQNRPEKLLPEMPQTLTW